MDRERERAYLMHIAECIDGIPKHLEILSPGQPWHEHYTVREAVLRTLQVMAESCTRLTEKTQALMPSVPWKDIHDFRNILVHDYLGDINYLIVTETIENDLPLLKAEILRVLSLS